LVQPGRSYASRNEDRQPLMSQNNPETQDKMTPPGPSQHVADDIQELQYMMKEYMKKMLNGLTTFVIKITQ